MIGFFMFILICILVSYMFFDSLWLSILSTILFANLINILFPKLFSGEDMYSDEAINKAKQQNYSKNLSYDDIMNLKTKERVAVLGLNSFQELYDKYPEYLRDVEKRHLDNIGKINIRQEDKLEETVNNLEAHNYIYEYDDLTAYDKFMDMSLEERMEILNMYYYTDMCRDYPQYVTYEEFVELLKLGKIYSIDDVIYFNGKYYHNENSEDFEEFEFDLDMKRRKS